MSSHTDLRCVLVAPFPPSQLYNKDGVAGAGGSLGGGSAQRAIMKVIEDQGSGSAAVSRRLASKWPRPEWRAPWKMYRVISGHLG